MANHHMNRGCPLAWGRMRDFPTGVRMSVAGAMVAMLTACAQPPKTLYDWQSYQPAVYAYLNDPGGDYAVQAQAMESNIETARSSNTALPPGFRAHLGMLYLKMGEDAKAIEQLEGEKLAFPEGTPFMNFLMRNSTSAPMPQPARPRTNAAVADHNLLSDKAALKEGISQ